MCSNRLFSVVRSTGALFRANSWYLQTVQLHRELSKYVMGVLSDNFTAGIFISLIMTVSVTDIERIQNKVIWLWIGTTCSVNVASTCSPNLYDISRREPFRRAPILNSLGPRKRKFASGWNCCITQRKQPISPLTDGMSAPTRIWPSRVSARTADCWTDVF